MQGNLALRDKKRYSGCMNMDYPGSVPADAMPTERTSTGQRRRPGGRSARVQAAVFEATMQLLVEKGYESLSFATIAERAGVHETSLYRRWKTKEQLVIDAISSQVSKNIPVPDTGALRSDLIQILHFLRIFLPSPAGQAIVQTALIAHHTPEMSSFHRDYWQQRLALIRPLFERAIARGELPPQTDIQLLFEALIGVFYVRLFGLREPLDETLPERVVDLVLSGVCMGGPSPL
jgi:AcrR family transcriptional regulator